MCVSKPRGTIVGRHISRCDGLLLLALLDSESMSRHAAEGMDMRLRALGRYLLPVSAKPYAGEMVFRSRPAVAVEHS